MKKFYSFIAAFLIVFSGCAGQKNDNLTTIRGLAEETKDGYYINGNVLVHEEITKYDPSYEYGEYSGKQLEVTGKTKEVTVEDCSSPTGEISQCRQGNSTYIYDIRSINIK